MAHVPEGLDAPEGPNKGWLLRSQRPEQPTERTLSVMAADFSPPNRCGCWLADRYPLGLLPGGEASGEWGASLDWLRGDSEATGSPRTLFLKGIQNIDLSRSWYFRVAHVRKGIMPSGAGYAEDCTAPFPRCKIEICLPSLPGRFVPANFHSCINVRYCCSVIWSVRNL